MRNYPMAAPSATKQVVFFQDNTNNYNLPVKCKQHKICLLVALKPAICSYIKPFRAPSAIMHRPNYRK